MNMRRPGGPIDEAAAWLATLSDPDCTVEERQAFARWLQRSNVNVEEFLTISTLTRRLETSSGWPELDIEGLIAAARRGEAGITRFPARPSQRQAAPRSDRRWPARWSWAAATAAVLIVTAVSFVAFDPAGWRDTNLYATTFGELRSVTLPDGSIVQLDAKSTLRQRFTDAGRNVELVHGAAIFRVAKDPARPFKVSTGFADIVAVGTAFNISARQERTIVTVLEGRVRVDRRAQGAAVDTDTAALELDPGQQAVIEPNKPLRSPTKVDPVKVTAWTARRLYFEDTPLAEAVQEFARYSARTIRIEDLALAGKRITGTFDAADPDALIVFLRRYTDAEINQAAQGWVVGGGRKQGQTFRLPHSTE
jgi:transmembrane sensor